MVTLRSWENNGLYLKTRLWSFPVGGTKTDSLVTNRYFTAGNNTVQIIGSGGRFDCKDTTTFDVVMYNLANVKFQRSHTTQCYFSKGNEFTFTDSSKAAGSITKNVNWDFGDTNTSQFNTTADYTSVKHSYLDTGTYYIRLITTNQYGCLDTGYNKVRVNPNPVANFTINNDTQCYSVNKVQFTNTGKSNSPVTSILSNTWDFGDTTTSSSASPSRTYQVYGKRTATLISANNYGCRDTISRDLRILKQPEAKISFVTNTQCVTNNKFEIADSALIDATDILSTTSYVVYHKPKNDTLTYTSSNVKFSMPDTGRYKVKSFVTTSLGCSDSSLNYINVMSMPIAKIEYDKIGKCEGNFNNFTLKRTNYVNSVNDQNFWSVAGTSIGTDTVISYKQNTPGKYIVKLKLVSEYGCPDSTTQELEIQSRPDVIITKTNTDSCLNKTLIVKAYEKTGLKLGYKLWTFSDASTSTDSLVTKKFLTAGKKDILFIGSAGRFNCRDTVSFYVNLFNSLNTKLQTSSLSSCLIGNLFTLTDSSAGAGLTTSKLRWVITDGFDSTYSPSKSFTSFKHKFASIGKYSIKLLAHNQYGCIDSVETIVTVNPNPTADFSIDNTTQCLTANLFSFTNLSAPNSTNPTLSYFWNFGDTTNTSNNNPKKSYNFDGQKKVKLVVINPYGCKDSMVSTIQIKPNPRVKFGINSLNQCINNNQYYFSDSSTVKSGGGTLKLIWQLGDGTVSNSKNILKKYSITGTLNVKLFGTTSFGCLDSFNQNIKLLPKPQSSFYLNKDTQCFVGNLFEFNNTSSIATGGGNVSFQWQFGDGNSSNSAHPNISYSNYGNYSVKLKSTSQFGCVDSLIKKILITANPKVSFTFLKPQKQCNNTDTFILFNTTQVLNAKSLNYEWNFGDGNTSLLKDVRKSYTAAGTYYIKLKATNNIGCLDSISQKVQVYPDPVVDYSVNSSNQCIRDQKFNFTNNTTIAFGGGTLNYSWKYDDTLFSSVANASKTFAKIGITKIKLIAKSSVGCLDSITKNIQVHASPIADFSISKPNQCADKNKYDFNNNSFIISGTNSYRWSFGDGQGSGVNSPVKVYNKFGNYLVKLVAISDYGCNDSISKLVKVYSEPKVILTQSDTAQCLYKNKFTFASKSTNGDSSSMSYRWSFGNSKLDTGSNVQTNYLASGTYLIKLIVTSKNSCMDSNFTFVKIHAQPLPAFNISNNNQCLYLNKYTATNLTTIASGGGKLSYLWKFGNGLSSDLKNPTWNYSQSNKYTVTLIAISSNQCKDSSKVNAEIYPNPIVNFNLSDSTACLKSNEFVTTNLSTISFGNLYYNWTFGNGVKSSGLNPKINYSIQGNYKIKLVAKSSVGCTDSLEKKIEVFPQPKSKFVINNPLQCLNGNNFQFTNSSTINYGTLNYKWTFGDSTNSNVADISHSYKYATNKIVKLTVTSLKGCVDESSIPISVYSNPKAAFYMNDSIQCKKNNDFVFYNVSKINNGLMNSNWNFGDKSLLSVPIGRHTFASPGFYQVQLKMVSNFNCVDTFSKWIKVTEEPTVNFYLDQYTSCFNNNQFKTDNRSSYNGTETVYYNWKFSDDSNSNNFNLIHKYKNDGKYQISLVAFTSEGCSDSINKIVTVYPQGKAKINFFDTVQCLLGNKFIFGNNSRVEGEKFSILSWSYGDGVIDTFISATPADYVYYDTGLFKVSLTTTTENQCQDESSGYVRVVPMPVSKFTKSAYSYCSNEQDFTFVAAPNSSNVVSQKWLIDRRELVNIDTLKYMFDNAGAYNVRLVKYTNFGCTDTFKSRVIVNEAPVANILSDLKEQCLDKNKFYFTNLSKGNSNPDENWIFYDGPFIDSRTGKSQDVNFEYPGTHLIELIVENDSLCSDTASMNVIVNPNPNAAIQVSNVCINQPVQIFSNASISDGSISKFEWNLGDGSNTVDSSPVNIYRYAKKFYLNLSVFSLKGCQSKFVDSIIVYPKPIARIAELTMRATILTDTLALLDSSDNAISYEWNFGDPNINSSYEYNPKVHYQDTGNYDVTLAVTSSDGCSDTTTKVIRIWPDFNLLFPTAFSPNNDGINDDFNAVGNFHSIKDFKMDIYNSDGLKVFETNDIFSAWNGKVMNNIEDLPIGNYEVIVRVRDLYNKQFNFTRKVALIR